MRRTVVAVLAVAALAAAAAASSSRVPTVAVPKAGRAPAGTGPLLAVVQGRRGPILGRVDRQTLGLARRSPRLALRNPVAAWGYSPDRRVLAVATEILPGTEDPIPLVQFVDPFSLRRLARTKLDDGHAAALVWAGDRVNLVLERWCCPASFDVVTIDAATHALVSRQRVENAVVNVQRAGNSIVVLTGPAAGIGTAGLTVVDPSGTVRSIVLGQIQAGTDLANADAPDFTQPHQNIPGLAVDAASGRAFVVPASGAIAQVSLASLAVSYHTVAEPVSFLGRLHDLLEPKAEAKGISGPVRAARWLGDGVIAVFGADESVSVDQNGDPAFGWKPAGLTFVDTNTWGAKSIDPGADSLTIAGDNLLATGSSWASQVQGQHGMGLVDYGFDGVRRLALFQGRPAFVGLVFRGRAYVYVEGVLKVVDLAAGTLLRDRVARLPSWLLVGDGSP
jgi:hypothetical protein